MSGPDTTPTSTPATERWVPVLFSALVPALGAVWAPAAWRLPLLAVAALVALAGVVLLVRQQGGRDDTA